MPSLSFLHAPVASNRVRLVAGGAAGLAFGVAFPSGGALASQLALSLALAATALALAARVGDVPWRSLGLARGPDGRRFAPAAAGAAFAGMVALGLGFAAFGGAGGHPPATASGPLGVAVVVLSSPLCEELLFRGAGLRRVVELAGPRAGVCVTALGFASLHPDAPVWAFASGLLLGLLAVARDGVREAFVVHAAWNALVLGLG